MREAENLQARKELAELKGNLLLTFQNEIRPGATEVTLKNIFSETSESIRIKLNPAKSVIENATRYFSKYKQMDKQKEVARIKKDTLEAELKRVSGIRNELQSARPARVQAIYKQLIQMKIVQDATSPAAAGKGDLQFAFKRVILEQDWDIYIGKNGPNNDLLTFEFAHKWDLWLHAQGVPGSHVIIRLPHKHIQPPRTVIERAAAIAAANSKARFSASVPVMLTEVRFVSRIRKALPGTVSVRNEEILFVEPLHLN
jgi:predicted ribosome quality control (RQC) complex YloA/Tae2 family protein